MEGKMGSQVQLAISHTILSSYFIGLSFIYKKKGLNRAAISRTHQVLSSYFIGLGFIYKKKGLNRAAISRTHQVLSSYFIGLSFIYKKKGLNRAAISRTHQVLEPIWWAGMITLIVGEGLNCLAYIYAPIVLITPVGALSLTISVVMAHRMLNEQLQMKTILGCVASILASVIVVVYSPQEHTPTNYKAQVLWIMTIQPVFLVFAMVGSALVWMDLRVCRIYKEVTYFINLLLMFSLGSLMDKFTSALGIEKTDETKHARTFFDISRFGLLPWTMYNFRDEVLRETFNAYIMLRAVTIGFLVLHYINVYALLPDWLIDDLASPWF